MPDRGRPDRGSPGRPGGDGGNTAPSYQAGHGEQAGGSAPSAGDADTGSRYYGSPGGEPGYSVLAVSDPAADVTSTQTWRAVGDGRSTGTWTAPAGPGGTTTGRHSAPPGVRRPGADEQPGAGPGTVPPERPGPGAARSAATGPNAVLAATGLGAAEATETEAARPDARRASGDSRDGMGRDGTGRSAGLDGDQRRSRGHSGAHSGPYPAVRGGRATRAELRSPAEPGAPAAPGSRPDSRRARGKRGKHPASVKLAISVALLLVLTAAATLAYTVLRTSAKPPKPAAAATPPTPKATPSASASPSLGPYGHIGSRQSDPQPLTVAQLYPASFTTGGSAVTLVASAISRHCGAAVTGSNIQSAVSAAHCDQAVRATYLARTQGLMGTIGVLNLSTATGAKKAANAADASDFISQLTAKRGPARKIGGGTGIEEALAKGHYLILIWAEFTDLRKPKTATQRSEVVTFMTDLLQNTANVSLTNRMLSGTP
jgi:hypothetical protein